MVNYNYDEAVEKLFHSPRFTMIYVKQPTLTQSMKETFFSGLSYFTAKIDSLHKNKREFFISFSEYKPSDPRPWFVKFIFEEKPLMHGMLFPDITTKFDGPGIITPETILKVGLDDIIEEINQDVALACHTEYYRFVVKTYQSILDKSREKETNINKEIY